MNRFLKQIKRIYAKRGKLGDLWRWAKKGTPRKRWKALMVWARRHERWNRAHHRADRAKWWAKKKTIYRRKWRKAKRHHKHTGQAPPYAAWMLNGHSSDIDDDLKPVVAYVVVVRGQAITDTYDYSGHTPSSLHYPRNDPTPPQQGHAIDSAGPDMCGSMTATRDQFGAAHFLELFGPCSWYIKNGAQFGGMFPGHGDHQHSAVA
jgi:hypothetical protein